MSKPVGRAIHYFPLVSVVLFWFGASFLGSLLVDTPHITHLGLVTLPFLAAAAAAWINIRRALAEKHSGKPDKPAAG